MYFSDFCSGFLFFNLLSIVHARRLFAWLLSRQRLLWEKGIVTCRAGREGEGGVGGGGGEGRGGRRAGRGRGGAGWEGEGGGGEGRGVG